MHKFFNLRKRWIIYILLILFLAAAVFFTGCASFEATVAANVDYDSSTYELAMGYKEKDVFHLLAFGNMGFRWKDTDKLIGTFGLLYEHYFSERIGLSGSLGGRFYQYDTDITYQITDTLTGKYKKTINSGAITMQFGLPISWEYFKITPYIGVNFYQTPQFNFGLSLAIRNEAAALLMMGIIKVLTETESSEDTL